MTMTLAGLVASIEAELASAQKARDAANAEVKTILAVANQENRSVLTTEEDQRIGELLAQRSSKDTELDAIRQRLEDAKRARADEDQVAALQQQRSDAAARPAYDRVGRVGTEARTYRQDTDRDGTLFLRDVTQQFLFRNPDAEARLARHMQEERVERGQYLQRAVGTGAFTGLTVPQYLTDMYAPATAAMRPFADVCNHHDLPPEGMTVNISRITTSTSAALQSSENSAVSETNIDDTLLTENVQTIAGQQTISRQAVDRGTGIEAVVMDDLFRRYSTTLDGTLITQATTGLSAAAQATTYTDGTPTADKLYPKILGACSNVEAALLAYGFPTHAIMHSRRWNWIASQTSSVWPFIQHQGLNPWVKGEQTGVGYDRGVRGLLPNGLQVVVDNNIATNLGTDTAQDEIYIIPNNECHLWEEAGAPMYIRAEQPAAASLGILIVVWGYIAYSFRRYTNGMSKISGTGLTTPTF